MIPHKGYSKPDWVGNNLFVQAAIFVIKGMKKPEIKSMVKDFL